MTQTDRPSSSTPAARSPRRPSIPPTRLVFLGLALVLLAIAVAACGTALAADPSASPLASAAASASASASHTPTPEPTPLRIAQPGADPVSLISWAFTPIFQTLFVILAIAYGLTGNVVIAIVILTLLIRFLTIRLSTRQIVSQQRMQKLQPELKAIQARYKNDRAMQMQAQQQFFKERGVSQTAGCLPSLLQMGLLFPMYWVIRDGLTNFNPTGMWKPFGLDLAPMLHCSNLVNGVADAYDKTRPCINTVVAGVDWSQPQVLFNLPLGFFTVGVSAIALVSAFLQVIQSRMIMPPPAENDPSASSQRSMMIFLPLISIIYGGFLPAGLFIYWIVTSLFSIVQQFAIVGFGSMFPLFGWSPAFAGRFVKSVSMPEPRLSGTSVAESRRMPVDRAASAASTVRPRPQRGRQGRRGRRR